MDGGVTGELFGDSAPIDVGGLGLYPASFVNDRGKNIYSKREKTRVGIAIQGWSDRYSHARNVRTHKQGDCSIEIGEEHELGVGVLEVRHDGRSEQVRQE